MFTVGHSTRTLEEFINLLKENDVRLLADIRTYPGSRRFPHFNTDSLAKSLADAGIAYIHIKDLGGRRKPVENSHNTAWRHEAFRGYADYMETEQFREGIKQLLGAGDQKDTAIMCSEAVWWKCHRSLVSDYLKSIGIPVIHILGKGKTEEHPYTSAARMKDGKLSYEDGLPLR